VWSRLELVGHMVICDDVVGTSCIIEYVWDQGETESAGMEGENYIMLDRHLAWSCCWLRNYGIAESIVSGGRDG